MNIQVTSQDWTFDLATHASSYTYNADKFAPLEDALFKKIRAYDPVYGAYLEEHLNRTSAELYEFLLYSGVDAKTSANIAAAFRVHDAGKILQDITVWEFTDEKPGKEKKILRSEHAALGPEILAQTMDEIGFIPDQDDLKHLDTIRHLMLNHHERLDGSGPRKLLAALICPILRKVALVDTMDGKYKVSDASTALSQMAGDKHKGQYDLAEIALYSGFLVKKGVISPPQVPQGLHPPAFQA